MGPTVLPKAKEYFLQRPAGYTRSLFCDVGVFPTHLNNLALCFSWQGKTEPRRICPPAHAEKFFRGIANFIDRSYIKSYVV